MKILYSNGLEVNYHELDKDICNYFNVLIKFNSFACIPNNGSYGYLSSISWYDLLAQAYEEGCFTLDEIREWYENQYTIEGEPEAKIKIPQVFKFISYLKEKGYKI